MTHKGRLVRLRCPQDGGKAYWFAVIRGWGHAICTSCVHEWRFLPGDPIEGWEDEDVQAIAERVAEAMVAGQPADPAGAVQ